MVAITLTNPVVQSYMLYSAILAFKLMLLSPMTGAMRGLRRVFANPEDAQLLKDSKVKLDDPVIERIRRAHLNDLENIPAFWVLGALYVTTGPVAAWATLLFRVYTLGRILHTIVYAVVPLPQPARFLAFVIPATVSFYMASQVILYYITAFNPVVQSYILYSAILAFKLLILSPVTGATRMSRRVFANPEDAKLLKGAKVKYDDPVVERFRRAHLNDLENIPAFWVLGALYVTTGPVAAWATLLFRVYTLGRILHTIVYAVVPLPQPARILAFVFPASVSFYMASQVILHYITAL
ncbi:uncharacterized protein LOC124640008 [Helicoverpa zea]|uniref:uncharacterized protein LOC124640008 n=1 Tax=Helicoverpa zea TaxID=7113 RepID=UPI001F5898A1|nr:uncharacterized protein LOC124640008 [Helicoverpa zea]